MRTQAQAAVIGGGVIGCSILNHLTKCGRSNVVLLGRDELTSRSTSHAAAGVHGPQDSNAMILGQYHKATVLEGPPFDPKGERPRG